MLQSSSHSSDEPQRARAVALHQGLEHRQFIEAEGAEHEIAGGDPDHVGQRHAGDVVAATVQTDEVPDAGRAQSQVHVVREDRFTGARARAAISGDDIFWLPLDEVATASALDPIDARRRASGAVGGQTYLTATFLSSRVS